MSTVKPAIALCMLLAPFSMGLASDEETQLLHTNPYQEYGQTQCTFPGDCLVLFPATTHITTVITNVSCQVTLSSGASTTAAVLGSEAFTGRFFVPMFYSGYSNGQTTYGINSATKLFIPQNVQPRFDVYSIGGPVSELFCTISGYHS